MRMIKHRPAYVGMVEKLTLGQSLELKKFTMIWVLVKKWSVKKCY